MSHEVVILIDEEGNVQVSVVGVKGQSCKAITKSIEEAFGETVFDKLTAEYYEQPVEQNQHVNRKQ